MMHYWWCGICERTAVNRQGDTDGVWRRKPWGVRVIDWISGRMPT